MKIKLLAITTVAFAFTAMGYAQTDPYLDGLRASLPSTDTIHDAHVATLYEAWKDAHGNLQSRGYMEFYFKASSTVTLLLTTDSTLAGFKDQNGVSFLQAKGHLKNVKTGEATDVYVEWYMADNRKAGSGPGDKPDVFAIHFWKPNSTSINFSSHWAFEGFHSVEIYRP